MAETTVSALLTDATAGEGAGSEAATRSRRCSA